MEQTFFENQAAACAGLMYRVAYTILRNDADCQDAVQEALLKAWAKRNQLKNDAYFRTWLVRIVVNASRDILRRRKRIIPVESVPERWDGVPDPALSDALDRLSEKLRLPLMLCYSENMSYQEISRALRIPITTVQSRLRQGKAKLREELKDDEA